MSINLENIVHCTDPLTLAIRATRRTGVQALSHVTRVDQYFCIQYCIQYCTAVLISVDRECVLHDRAIRAWLHDCARLCSTSVRSP